VAALEKAAAQLRADAARLESEVDERRREEQAKWFRVFDTDSSGAIDAAELREGMKELMGYDLDEKMAERLLQASDKNGDGLLQPQEFETSQLEATLERLKAEDHDREVAAWKEQRRVADEAKANMERQRKVAAYEATLPVANEDLGPLTRIGSVLVYLLPLLDALKFGAPLAASSGAVKAMLTPLLGPLHLMNSIPCGQLLFFITLQTLADNTELPLLLRFNMRQAVVLDITLGVLQLLQVLAAYAAFGEAPADIVSQWDSNGLVFIALCGCIAYSSIMSLLGLVPNTIPWISPYAERYMAPTRRDNGGVQTEASNTGDSEDAPPAA